jgi:hypothetical protein
MARVWFLWQADPPAGNLEAARPMVSANGAPIAESKEATAFFHDFPPGPYKFKVQAYGTPAGESDRLRLAPGVQTYLQVEAVPNWEEGSTAGGWSFAVLTMTPQLAQQYLPTMTNLGPLIAAVTALTAPARSCRCGGSIPSGGEPPQPPPEETAGK